jgi:hypothetical protein
MSMHTHEAIAPDVRAEHPLDVVERLATLRRWEFSREDDDEMHVSAKGNWAEYNIAFTWIEDVETIHVACAFELKVPAVRRREALELANSINAGLWIGHFDIWHSDDAIMYRNATLLTGDIELSEAQCEMMLKAAVESCERYFQSFQFVVWAGKSAKEALEHTVMETEGNA